MIEPRQSRFHAQSIRLLVAAGLLILVWIVVFSITGTQIHLGGSKDAEMPTPTHSLHIPHIHLPLDHHEPLDPASSTEPESATETDEATSHEDETSTPPAGENVAEGDADEKGSAERKEVRARRSNTRTGRA